jgi:hypothetical protein
MPKAYLLPLRSDHSWQRETFRRLLGLSVYRFVTGSTTFSYANDPENTAYVLPSHVLQHSTATSGIFLGHAIFLFDDELSLFQRADFS